MSSENNCEDELYSIKSEETTEESTEIEELVEVYIPKTAKLAPFLVT